MGSGYSSQAPNETQSAPTTACTTPNKPKRITQFEEVQIANKGINPRSHQQTQPQGSSTHPNKLKLPEAPKCKTLEHLEAQEHRTEVNNKRLLDSELQQTERRKDGAIVFETFYHRSGKEFQCILQNGMRFYIDDWGSKEWQLFPKRWYNEGLLVTNIELKDDSLDKTVKAGVSEESQHLESQGGSKGHRSSQGSGDDRAGFSMHPTRGRIPTYIFYKKHNVHMYFDRDKGSWVRMPTEWELHHDMVKSLVDQVDEAVPSWGDRNSILALLRACNYDPDDCIAIYLHLQKDEWMKGPKTTKESELLREKEEKILDLEKRIRQLCIERKTDLTELDEETDAQLSATASGGPRTMEVGGRKAGGGAVPGAVKKGESP